MSRSRPATVWTTGRGGEKLDLVGLARPGRRTSVDKVLKGARRHP